MNNIDSLIKRLNYNKTIYAGYPTATDFDNSSCYYLLNQHLNNIGNPYTSGSCFSTFGHERAVLNFFMKNFNTDSDKSWGYIASCSTEAILFASWRCREHFQNKDVILISSEYSHYCVDKIAKIINIRNYRIASNKNGDINLDKFKTFIETVWEKR